MVVRAVSFVACVMIRAQNGVGAMGKVASGGFMMLKPALYKLVRSLP